MLRRLGCPKEILKEYYDPEENQPSLSLFFFSFFRSIFQLIGFSSAFVVLRSTFIVEALEVRRWHILFEILDL